MGHCFEESQFHRKIEEARSETEVWSALAQGLTDLLSADGTAILTVDSGKRRLVGRLGVPAEKWPNISKVSINLEEPVATSLAVKTKAPVMVPDTREDPLIKQWLAAYFRCTAVLALPVFADKEVFGCALVKEDNRPRRFTDEEIRKAQNLIAAAGAVLRQNG